MSQNSKKALLKYSEHKVKQMRTCERSVATLSALLYPSPLGYLCNSEKHKDHWDLMKVHLDSLE